MCNYKLCLYIYKQNIYYLLQNDSEYKVAA